MARTKATKKASASAMVVLGLRATSFQRQWMSQMAAERGLSIQAYFEEVMRQQQGKDNPWVSPGDILISVPVACVEMIQCVADIFRSGGETLPRLLADNIRAFWKEHNRTKTREAP